MGVEIHPISDAPVNRYKGVGFTDIGLRTNHPFDLAYQAAVDFTDLLQKRTKAAGFMKTMLLQRICSSFASGMSTAQKMLKKEELEDERPGQTGEQTAG